MGHGNSGNRDRRLKDSTPFPLLFLFLIVLFAGGCQTSSPPGYQNPELPPEKRAADLLSRMSLEEKIGQLRCGDDSDRLAEYAKSGFGALACVLRNDGPWEAAVKANEIQRLFLEKSRLGIPVIIHDEGLHGLIARRATIYPQAIGLAATWDIELMERVAAATGEEARARGIRQLLSPVVNIARDVRWGRVEETYGEDPHLASRMGAAFCAALQAHGVIATPKHFVANSGAGGRDSNAVDFNERLLREIYFPAFKACIQEGGALSLMTAYNSINGFPCSSNRRLLTEILKEEWGFGGFVVSDYGSIGGIKDSHKIASNWQEAAEQAIEAGVDMELSTGIIYGAPLLEVLKNGLVKEAVVDEAVRRILAAKFSVGLFENHFVDPEESERKTDSAGHRALALESARKALVLLKNEDGTLPLRCDLSSIAVLGPAADEARLGGYSGFDRKVVTVLEGIRNTVSPSTRIRWAKGCDIETADDSQLEEAVDLASGADAAIIVCGIVEGEGRDRAKLGLPGKQEELIRRTAETGVPVIVILVNGSAVTMDGWIDGVKGVIEAWYPGEEGGNAVADVLFGEFNPGGRLPITFPRYVGQVPLFYNDKPSGRGADYVDLSGKPLFPFGYGLSYTTFAYDNLKMSPETVPASGTITVSLDVENTGGISGEEVVQLYIRRHAAGLVTPVKELRGFRRIGLAPGENKTVTFSLKAEDLSVLGPDLKQTVGADGVEIMVGASSEDIRLTGQLIDARAVRDVRGYRAGVRR